MTLLHFWWVLPILAALILYRFVLRFIFGMVIVPQDKIGLITKKFVLFGDNKSLPDGRIVAIHGEAGFQAKTLAPGLYWGLWVWQYEIKMEGFTIIPEGEVGLIMANDGAQMPNATILGGYVDSDNFQDAVKFLNNGGQKGRQAAYITSGVYRINTLLFSVYSSKMFKVRDNLVGVITALDGKPLDKNQIAGDLIEGHNNFQDFNAFIKNGGQKGLQPQVILSGSYNLNPWAVQVEEIEMTEIPIGYVGVVISYIGQDGDDVSGTDFKHGNIVAKGSKGVWAEPWGPGKYPINTKTMRVELVPTTNLVLNWADNRNESHNLDANLSTIKVRSKDGFTFNLDVSQIIHVPNTEAPKVIARFGNMINLVSQVLEPTIGNYFRNSAQDSDVISFLTDRKQRQQNAKGHIKEVLDQYNVNAVDTLIGDIVPPESLMKTLTDRKIAEEQKVTYKTQQDAQMTRQGMEKETAIADMQKEIQRATQSVEIAEKDADSTVKKAKGAAEAVKLSASANAEATKINGEAEAAKITAIGKANAEAYEQQVKAMGNDNFARLKVTEVLAEGKIKLMPDVFINGGGNSSAMDGLLGLKLLESINPDAKAKTETK